MQRDELGDQAPVPRLEPAERLDALGPQLPALGPPPLALGQSCRHWSSPASISPCVYASERLISSREGDELVDAPGRARTCTCGF